MTRFVFTLAALLLGAGASAADSTRPFAAPAAMDGATPPGVGSLGQVTLSLGLVLALIFAVAWLARRMRGLNRASTDALDVIATLPLGQKERAVLVRVGKQQILLGVAPGRVTALHVLAEPVDITTPTPAGPASAEKPSFKALLLKSLGK
ncbi:MAG TPA: flagellar biosynthetic protein FliO [Steroidobacteraceae bacterium]|nr:flagellar biosynthetic protein FliO [Steroidobacteraceae bacterium]